MPVTLDEYPIHQTSLSMAQVATTDRNFYDRCYFNAFDPAGGGPMLITGLGIYPNLGVMDAYATVGDGDKQRAVRFSDELAANRLDQRVGPYRIEVVEPLRKIRLRCDGDEHGIGFDLTWEGIVPCRPGAAARDPRRGADDPRHVAVRPVGQLERRAHRGRHAAGSLRLGRQPGPLVGHPPRRGAGAARSPAGRAHRRLLVAVRAAALRALRRDRDRAGRTGRLPHPQRRGPDMAGRAARAAGLATGRDRATGPAAGIRNGLG